MREWLHEYRAILYKVIRSYAVAIQDQEDLFQEISFQLWKSIGNFNGTSKTSTWIYRVSINTALNWKRSEKKRKGYASIEILTEIADTSNSKKIDDDVINQLYSHINQLTRGERAIILLSLDGLSYNEIADIVGINASHVGVKLSRIKNKLTTNMKGIIHELQRS